MTTASFQIGLALASTLLHGPPAMPAKKAAKKVAKKAAKNAPAKKVVKKAAKKTVTKKVAKKAAPKKAAKKATKPVPATAPRKKSLKDAAIPAQVSLDVIRHSAYLNYCDRLGRGFPADPVTDWLMAVEYHSA